jgi:hypothetical protein
VFSRSAGYEVQALTYLPAQPPGKLTGAREIAIAVKIPMPFSWKILRNLSQQKLVRSLKRGSLAAVGTLPTVLVLEGLPIAIEDRLRKTTLSDLGAHTPTARRRPVKIAVSITEPKPVTSPSLSPSRCDAAQKWVSPITSFYEQVVENFIERRCDRSMPILIGRVIPMFE